MSTPTSTTPRLDPASQFSASKEFRLARGRWHSFSLNGDGVWQHWNGAAWVSYTEGSGKDFQAKPPVSGRVRLLVNSGTVSAGFERHGLATN